LEDTIRPGVAADFPVDRVAFDGGVAGFADEALDVGDVEFLVGGGAGLAFGDVVPDDGAVEVIAAEVECELGEADALHDPEGLDMRYIIEHETGNGEGFEVGEARGGGEVAEVAVCGDEGEGDHAVEAGTGERRSDGATERRRGGRHV